MDYRTHKLTPTLRENYTQLSTLPSTTGLPPGYQQATLPSTTRLPYHLPPGYQPSYPPTHTIKKNSLIRRLMDYRTHNYYTTPNIYYHDTYPLSIHPKHSQKFQIQHYQPLSHFHVTVVLSPYKLP